MEPKYIGKQTFYVGYPVTQDVLLTLNSLYPVDKIRISVSYNFKYAGYTPGILVWTDLVNNYVASAATNYIGAGEFNDSLKPANGMEFWYPTKMILQGDYVFRLTDFSETAPTIAAGSVLMICIEYYQYE